MSRRNWALLPSVHCGPSVCLWGTGVREKALNWVCGRLGHGAPRGRVPGEVTLSLPLWPPSADQALDRFAMKKYYDDKVSALMQPSQKR